MKECWRRWRKNNLLALSLVLDYLCLTFVKMLAPARNRTWRPVKARFSRPVQYHYATEAIKKDWIIGFKDYYPAFNNIYISSWVDYQEMVWEIVLYTLGIYFIVKSLLVLIFKKPLMSWALKIAKRNKSVNGLIVLELILGIILIVTGYLVF